MYRKFSFVIVLILVPRVLFAASLPSYTSLSDSTRSPELKNSYWNIKGNLSEIYLSRSSLYHLGAVGATWALIETGVDADVQVWSAKRNKDLSIWLSLPGLVLGYFAPVVVPLGLYHFSDEIETRNAGLAAGQAVGIAFATTNLLKAITGRLAPEKHILADVKSRTKDFRFGFGRRGVYNGWPSGHAMTNMALAAALANYYSDSKKIRIISYSWAAYVMASATFGDLGDVHWASDVVAGGLMGWVIGRTVGKAYARSDGGVRKVSWHPTLIIGNHKTHVGFQLNF